MIDINELRRKLHSGDVVDHIDIHANVQPIITEILDRLEAAEKDIALTERVIDSLGLALNAVANERDELRAKIEAMEKQEPDGWLQHAARMAALARKLREPDWHFESIREMQRELCALEEAALSAAPEAKP